MFLDSLALINCCIECIQYTVPLKSKLPVVSCVMLRDSRIIEAAIFGINYWRHIQPETDFKFHVALQRLRKTGVTFCDKCLSRRFLSLSLAHCLIGVSEFLDLLAIDIWHCIWSWRLFCWNVKTTPNFLNFLNEQINVRIHVNCQQFITL